MAKRLPATVETQPKPDAVPPAPTVTPLRQTILWLLEGNSNEDVAEAIRASFPKADPEKLLAAAGEHFAAVAQSDQDVVVGWALDAMRELHRRMMAIGDFPGSLRAVERLIHHSKALKRKVPAARNQAA